MTERIRELTFQAGAKLYSEPPMREVTGVSMSFESVEKFAELVRADEREACAKVCDEWNTAITDKLAAAIRARG